MTTSNDLRATALLLTDVFCSCRTAVQSDIGNIAGQLFHRVEIEGESLDCVAADLGLAPSDAKAFLSVTFSLVADALVAQISANTVAAPRKDQRPH